MDRETVPGMTAEKPCAPLAVGPNCWINCQAAGDSLYGLVDRTCDGCDGEVKGGV